MVDQIVAAHNFTAWVSLFLTSGVLWYYISQEHEWSGLVTVALIGAALNDLGWAFHRFYWWLWRNLRSWGEHDAAEWFVTNGWVTSIFFMMVFVGSAMLMSPVSSTIFGRWWPHVSAVFFAVLSAIGFYIATHAP